MAEKVQQLVLGLTEDLLAQLTVTAQVTVAEAGFVAEAPAEPVDHVLRQLVTDGDTGELVIDQTA